MKMYEVKTSTGRVIVRAKNAEQAMEKHNGTEAQRVFPQVVAVFEENQESSE